MFPCEKHKFYDLISGQSNKREGKNSFVFIQNEKKSRNPNSESAPPCVKDIIKLSTSSWTSHDSSSVKLPSFLMHLSQCGPVCERHILQCAALECPLPRLWPSLPSLQCLWWTGDNKKNHAETTELFYFHADAEDKEQPV